MKSEPAERPRPGPVPRYARIEVIGGATMVVIAGLVWYGAIELDVGKIVNFGPGAMPKSLAIILLVAGGAVLLRGLVQRVEEVRRFEFALRPTAILVLSIVLFGLFIRGGRFGPVSTPQLGLMVVGPLTVFIVGCAAHEARVTELLVLAFGLTAAMLVIFSDLLGVTLPVFPKLVQSAIPPAFGADAAVRALYCVYGALAGALYVAFIGLPEHRRG